MAKQSLLRDPKHKGRYIKLGEVFVKLSDIVKVDVVNDAQGKRLVIRRKGKSDHIYRGISVDRIKVILDQAGNV